MLDDSHFPSGDNVYQGKVAYKAVSDALGYEFHDPKETLTR